MRSRTIPGRVVMRGRKQSEPDSERPPRLTRLRSSFRRRRRTLLRVAILALISFAVGYGLAALWLFPGAEGTADLRLVRVPDLVGRSSAQAAEELSAAGLEPAVLPGLHSPEAPPGEIVAQVPLPGQLASSGDTVRLTPSLGGEEREVPDLVGVSARQATAVLQRLGFETETRIVPSARGREGVQGTRPAAGERLSLPATVEIQVGEGPQVAVVPDLRGRHVDDVRPLLTDAGLQLGDVRFEPTAEEAPGRIIGQTPPAGFSARVGGPVSIEVAGEPGAIGPLEEPSDTTAAPDSTKREPLGRS